MTLQSEDLDQIIAQVRNAHMFGDELFRFIEQQMRRAHALGRATQRAEMERLGWKAP